MIMRAKVNNVRLWRSKQRSKARQRVGCSLTTRASNAGQDFLAVRSVFGSVSSPDLTRYDVWAYGLFAAPVRSFQPWAIQIQKETIVLMEEMLGESLILRRSIVGSQ